MMNYEKKYEEALERAKRWADGTLQPERTTPQGVCEAIFPELRESESERVRKQIEQVLIEYDWSVTYLVSKEDCLAWLEKQKEPETASASSIPSCWEEKQKPAEDSDFKTKLASYMEKNQENGRYALSSESILEMAEEELLKRGVVQKPAEWNKKGKEIIDWACCYLGDYAASFKDKNERKSNMLYELSSKLNSLRTQPKVEWSEDIIRKAVKEVGLTQHQIDWFKTNVFPPKQEWSEEEKKRIRQNGRLDVCYNPEKYGLCHKIDWGEEDERMLSRCVKSIESSKQFADSDTFKKAKDHEIDWLENRIKSLRPQPKCLPGFDEMTPEEKMNHPLYLEGFDVGRDVGKVETDWKPSEEQMKALQNAVALTACDKELVKLYNQLKKLMEE